MPGEIGDGDSGGERVGAPVKGHTIGIDCELDRPFLSLTQHVLYRQYIAGRGRGHVVGLVHPQNTGELVGHLEQKDVQTDQLVPPVVVAMLNGKRLGRRGIGRGRITGVHDGGDFGGQRVNVDALSGSDRLRGMWQS